MKAAIIGMGVVGQANAKWLDGHVHVTYDPKTDDEYPAEEISKCDFAVVCVPTPTCADGCNLDYVLDAIVNLPETLPVLLRSTVPPGTTEQLGRNVVFCPEFVQERADALWKQSDDVPFLILGGTEAMAGLFEFWFETGELFEGRIYCTAPRVAELVKYTINAFLATKVTFANEMSRVSSVFGVDWREVEALWRVDPRTGYTHTSVEHPGGFGGACFPKDLAAIIHAAQLGEYDAEFLQAVEEANARFRQ